MTRALFIKETRSLLAVNKALLAVGRALLAVSRALLAVGSIFWQWVGLCW